MSQGQIHLTIGIFGERTRSNELAGKLAKKGTTNDIAIYNHASSEGVLTYVVPNSESGKIAPLLECLNMCDVPVLVVDGLTKETGELIIAISEAGFREGLIMAAPGVSEAIRPFIETAGMKGFTFVNDEGDIRRTVAEFGGKIPREEESKGPLVVPIDNCFKVRGVGTIVLAMVKSGTIRKHDSVMVEPTGKAVTIKGIQSQDHDIDEATAGMRAGLNLKDVEPEDIKRGYVICDPSEGVLKKSGEISLRFSRNPIFKQDVKEGTRVMLSCGLQVESCTVKAVTADTLSLTASNPVAYAVGQRCIVASQNDILPRIIGGGITVAP